MALVVSSSMRKLRNSSDLELFLKPSLKNTLGLAVSRLGTEEEG